MTISKTFNKCAIALTLSTLFTATISTANPNQTVSSLITDMPVKLQSQTGFETQFIIKYKNNSNEMASLSALDATPSSMNKRAQSFVKGFSSKKGKAKGKYVRAMALNNHHVTHESKQNPGKVSKIMQIIKKTK